MTSLASYGMSPRVTLNVAYLAARSTIDSSTGCHVWWRALNSHGYGAIRNGGKDYGAHVVAYRLLVGPIPDGMCVCHRCDNRRCINPEHLFLATNQGNTADKVAKGRQNRGSTVGNAQLTEERAQKAIDMIADGASNAQVAAEVGTSTSNIHLIRHNKAWRHLPRPGQFCGEIRQVG